MEKFDCNYNDEMLFTNKRIFHDKEEHSYEVISFDSFAIAHRNDDEDTSAPEYLVLHYHKMEDIDKDLKEEILRYRFYYDWYRYKLTYDDICIYLGKLKNDHVDYSCVFEAYRREHK